MPWIMVIIWWGTEGEGQNIWCPTHFWGWKKTNIFQYLFVFYGHFYWTYPDHMFSLSTHIQIILSMYSIHRMRGNGNQRVNTVKREIFAANKFSGFDHKAILVRFNFARFSLAVCWIYMEQNICGRFNFAMGNMSSTCKFQYIFQKNIQCTWWCTTLNNVLRQLQWP